MNRPVLGLDGANNLRYSFTRNASGQLLTMTDHTGSSPVNYFYVLNDHGDVLGLRDNNGTMVVSYSYDAFGNPTTTTGTGKHTERRRSSGIYNGC
jgi:YD repeat-containing protein